MCFCLQLNKLKPISHGKFEQLIWLPVTYRFKQCVNSTLFRYFNGYFKRHYSEKFSVKR